MTPEFRLAWFSPWVIPVFFSKTKMPLRRLESSQATAHPMTPLPTMAIWMWFRKRINLSVRSVAQVSEATGGKKPCDQVHHPLAACLRAQDKAKILYPL
jgi:hypothetical protein